MRALILEGMSQSSLMLSGLRSEDIEGTDKMKVVSRVARSEVLDEGRKRGRSKAPIMKLAQ